MGVLAACSGAQSSLLPSTTSKDDHSVRPLCGQPLVRVHSMTIVVCPTPDPFPSGGAPCVVGCLPPDPPTDPCLTDPNGIACLGYSNGPAQYNDQCTKDAEQIGHDVPGQAPTRSVAIINEYPVDLGSTLIGYVYTTWGNGYGANGNAFFVPVSSAVGAGIVSIGTTTSFEVGSNSFIQGLPGNTLLNVLAKVLTAGKSPTVQEACYTSNWNGKYTV